MKVNLKHLAFSATLAVAASAYTQSIKAEQIMFEPIVINNVDITGTKAPYPINEPELRRALGTQFDTWMVRSVTRNHLAAKADPIGKSKLKTGDFLIRAVFEIPLTHAADMSHWDNQYRRGKFMSFRLSISDPSGKTVLESKGDLTWGDGEWSRFMGRGRHKDNAHEEVLTGYIRKAVDRGVLGLKKQMK